MRLVELQNYLLLNGNCLYIHLLKAFFSSEDNIGSILHDTYYGAVLHGHLIHGKES